MPVELPYKDEMLLLLLGWITLRIDPLLSPLPERLRPIRWKGLPVAGLSALEDGPFPSTNDENQTQRRVQLGINRYLVWCIPYPTIVLSPEMLVKINTG